MKRYLPVAAFIIVSAIGLAMTALIFTTEKVAERRGLEIMADEAVDRIREKVEHDISIVTATNSFFEASDGVVSRKEFQTFALGLVLSGELSGMQGIGFARYMPSSELDKARDEILKNYELDRDVWPRTNMDYATPIVLLEPLDVRNKAALGFDMFSEPSRRAAMLASLKDGTVRMSAPVQLVQEITEEKQTGFLAYLPLKKSGANLAANLDKKDKILGFVYAPFRSGDLHRAALSSPTPAPVLVETYDTTDEQPVLMFRSEHYEEHASDPDTVIHRSLDIAGRHWTISVVDGYPSYHSVPYWRSLILGAVSLLFAAALAVSIRAQTRATEARNRLKEVSEKTIQEKDLMLQEMKHRIKNSIARILAMARQTAQSADTLDDFSTSFSARLQAMAHAQDLLTRSRWESADLRALLTQELEQVFGESSEKLVLVGPSVMLNEKQTHALGLVFHELATNAMKYSDIFGPGGEFSVEWKITGSAKIPELELEWSENSGKAIKLPEKNGFGSRLMDVSIKGELGGSILREFAESGLKVHIKLPLSGPESLKTRR